MLLPDPDRRQAPGYRCCADKEVCTEELLILRVNALMSWWRRPSLVIRHYPNDVTTIAEAEWKG